MPTKTFHSPLMQGTGNKSTHLYEIDSDISEKLSARQGNDQERIEQGKGWIEKETEKVKTGQNIQTEIPEHELFNRQKAQDIQDTVKRKDAGRLRSLAESKGGLLNDGLRREAWPILLGVSTFLEPSQHEEENLEKKEPGFDALADECQDLPPHGDEGQVELDVNRSFIYYPNNESEAKIIRRKHDLSILITSVLRHHPFLHYFQGYHDIAQVLLLILPPHLLLQCVSRLSVLRIRDFMLPTLAPTTAQLRLLPDILSKADPKLWQHLHGVEPFYALSGTLTMFAHNIQNYGEIARLFDVLIAREPVFSIYLFAQIVLHRRDEIFEIDEPDVLHVILGKVPTTMDLDALISSAISLFNAHPPETLQSWHHISAFSALKTVRDVEDYKSQTLEQGREWFDRQAKELRWVELRDHAKFLVWRYRRHATTVGMALAVGALAIYLRKHPAVLNSASYYILRFLGSR